MRARYSAASAWRRCSPSCCEILRGRLRNANRRGRRRRSAASVQIVNSGATNPMLAQTSSSSSCAIWRSSRRRSRFASTPGIRSAAANRSARFPEDRRRRCSAMISLILNAALVSIYGGLGKIVWKVKGGDQRFSSHYPAKMAGFSIFSVYLEWRERKRHAEEGVRPRRAEQNRRLCNHWLQWRHV